TDNRSDISGVTCLDVLVVVRLNLNESSDAFGAASARVKHLVTLRNFTGIDADENEFADKFVRPKLEGERAEFAVVVSRRLEEEGFIVLPHPLCRGNLKGTGQVIHHCIQQVLDALVFESRTTDNRDDGVGDGRPTKTGLDVRGENLGFVEKHQPDLLIDIRESLEERFASLHR